MNRPLILTVTPRGPKGVWVGRIEGTEFRLIASRSPMLSAARSLLALGVDPRTVLTLRWQGSSIDRISGPLSAVILREKKGRRTAREARPAAQNRGAGT
jgi:hypothetical protein